MERPLNRQKRQRQYKRSMVSNAYPWAITVRTLQGTEVYCTICMKVFVKVLSKRKHDTDKYQRHSETATHQKNVKDKQTIGTSSLTTFLGKGKEQVSNYLTSIVFGIQNDQAFNQISKTQGFYESLHLCMAPPTTTDDK